ncbi:hypothetical protein Tco_0808671 [Tanacetum coccineum]
MIPEEESIDNAFARFNTIITSLKALDEVIMEYLVNISKRRAFWSLNEDILKITILKTNTPYPSRKIRRIHACTHQRPQRNEAQYANSHVTHTQAPPQSDNQTQHTPPLSPREVIVSVYNRFAQLMNDLERNDMHVPILTINTKFLNSLQPEWLKYVTQVRLAKRLTVDSLDDLFDYLQQFEKLVNVSRAKKLEKSHDPLALIAHTDEYQQDDVHTNYEDPRASAMLNSGNAGRIIDELCSGGIVAGSTAPTEDQNVQRNSLEPVFRKTTSLFNVTTVEKGHYARNVPKAKFGNPKYFMEQIFKDGKKIEETQWQTYVMAILQPPDNTSDVEASYDSDL